jgi:hypothetical protein
MQTTYYLNPGQVTSIVADAGVLQGSYQVLGNPGEANEAAVALSAGVTKNLGPYNTGKFLKLYAASGNMTHSESFGGYAYSDDVVSDDQIGSTPIASVTSTESQGIWKRTKLTLTAAPITITDDAGVAQYGGVKIYDFPEGLINFQGAVVTGNLTGGVTGTIINAFTGVFALGSATATTGSTLVSTEADILPSTALTTAVSKVAAVKGVSTATALTESGGRWMDGTVTPKDLYLNFAIADDASHTSGSATFTGTVEFLWAIVGDA